MADSVASPAASQRGWVVPSLAVLALIAIGLGYGLYQSNQGATALEKRVATLETGTSSAATLASDLSALKTQMSDLSAKVAEAPGKLDALDARLASLEKATPAAAPDLTGVTADLGALKTDLAALKAQIGDLAPDKLVVLKTELDQLSAAIPAPVDTSQLATTIAALDGQVQALQVKLTEGTPAAPAVEPSPQLATLQGDVDSLKSKLSSLDIGPVTAELGDVKAQVDKLNTQVAELPARSDLTALQTRLDQIASTPATSAPPLDIAPLQADIGELKTRVTAVETSGKTDTGTVAALRTDLDGLSGRVNALEGAGPSPALTTLQASLGDLKQEIAALASGSDVKALQAAVSDLQNQPKPTAGVQPKLLQQVYFDRGSYQLSDAELAKLSALAQQLTSTPREVAVMGFTDTQGPPEFNRALSLKRASAVRKALLGYGIGNSLITSLSGLGEDGPPVDTKANTPEQQNRTVMIYANE